MTFNEAFREARKLGLKKFQWKGNWYGTQYATEKNSPTVSYITQGKGQQKIANSNGTVSDRYTIRKDNGLYFIWDKLDNRIAGGKSFKTKEDAINYGNSKKFKDDTSEVTVVASGKINGNTQGYIPVLGTGLVDKNGNTRVYKNYETGQRVVVDNYGNKVADSYDMNSELPGFLGWVINTGSKSDIRRALAGQARNESNLNEQNLKSKLDKERKTDERAFQNQGILDMLGMLNLGQSMINLPNHAITGALKLARNDYNLLDYAQGFTLDGMWNGKQQIGLGDLLEIESPTGRVVTNLINPLTIAGTAAGTKAKLSTVKAEPGKSFKMIVTEDSGPSSSFRRNNRPNEGMGNSKLSRSRGNKTYVTLYGGSHRSGSNPILRTVEFPTTVLVRRPGNISVNPYLTDFKFERDTLNRPVIVLEVPTANFYYTNGQPNLTVLGRILTGDFVEGTTGPNWDGTINGGSVIIDNTNNNASSNNFNGITIGNGKDNYTNRYLYRGYKSGGTMNLNKFQQGGKTSPKQDVVMEFVQNLAKTLQMDPNEIIAISQLYPEILEKTVETYLNNKEDIKKAALTFTQELLTKIQAKRHGSKLNYVKSLKNKCAEDEELYYYKKGGSVGCGCKKKEQGGELKEKKESTVSKFKKACGGFKVKFMKGGLSPKKKNLDQASQDSTEINNNQNMELMSERPGKLIPNPKYDKGKTDDRALLWVPDRTKTPYKKEEKVKKDCGGSKMKLGKGDKVKSAGTGCIAKFKMHRQGGNLIKKYQNAGTITTITPTGSITTPELVDWNKFNDITLKYSIKDPGFGYTPKFLYTPTVQDTKFLETPEFDPNAGYDEAYNRYRLELWSRGKRLNPRKAEKRFKEYWDADVENRRNRFNQQANLGVTKLDLLIKLNQLWRKDNALISNFRRDMEKILMEADKDVNDLISLNNQPVQAAPAQLFNTNYWLSKAKPYGFNTIDEVKEWQKQNGLNPDGKFGEKSIEKYFLSTEGYKPSNINSNSSKSNPEDLINPPSKPNFKFDPEWFNGGIAAYSFGSTPKAKITEGGVNAFNRIAKEHGYNGPYLTADDIRNIDNYDKIFEKINGGSAVPWERWISDNVLGFLLNALH